MLSAASSTNADRKYLITRGFGFVIQTGLLATNLATEMIKENTSPFLWFAYLTHLNLLLTFAYEAIMAALTLHTLYKHKPISDLIEKFPVLRDAAVTTSIAVSLLYWGLDRTGNLFVTPLFHGVNTLLLLSEIFINKQSYVPNLLSWRFAVPLIGAALYIASEAAMTFANITKGNGEPLYKALPWKTDPGSASIWASLGIALFALIPLTAYSVRVVKDKCRHSFFSKNTSQADNSLLIPINQSDSPKAKPTI